MLDAQVDAVLASYPALHAAWRRREVRDPATGRRLSDHLAGILDHLDPTEPLGAGELAGRMGVTPATISIQLGRLIRLRLVSRERDAGDARRVRLRLTEAGVRMRSLRSLLDPIRVREALGRLPADERDAAVEGLRALARAAVAEAEPIRSRQSTSRRARRNSE